MSKRRAIRQCADFELVFTEIGAVELVDVRDPRRECIWASDDDEDFAEEFDADFFDGEDAEDIIAYLEDADYLPVDAVLDIVEIDADEEDEIDKGNIIDADFTERKGKRR